MTTKDSVVRKHAAGPGRNRRRGAELLEFTLVFLPLLAMLSFIMNTAWAIFAKSTLQRAAQVGVRTGITLTSGQMVGGACLTDTIKAKVQASSIGLLSGSTGLSRIKVHYFKPPDATSTSAATDVSATAAGNEPGNIMRVSVENFPLVPLMPRIFGWGEKADTNPLMVTVYSADLIEPSSNPPCIGTAP